MKIKTVIISTVLTASVLAGSIYGAYRYSQSTKKPVLVAPVTAVKYDYWGGDEAESYSGEIVTRDTQRISLDTENKLINVFVKEGDHVKIGDRLLEYDTELLELKKEMSEIDLQQLSIQLSMEERTARKYGVDPSTITMAEPIDVSKVSEKDPNEQAEASVSITKTFHVMDELQVELETGTVEIEETSDQVTAQSSGDEADNSNISSSTEEETNASVQNNQNNSPQQDEQESEVIQGNNGNDASQNQPPEQNNNSNQQTDPGNEPSSEPVSEKQTEEMSEPDSEKQTEEILDPTSEKQTEEIPEPASEEPNTEEPVSEKETEQNSESEEPATEEDAGTKQLLENINSFLNKSSILIEYMKDTDKPETAKVLEYIKDAFKESENIFSKKPSDSYTKDIFERDRILIHYSLISEIDNLKDPELKEEIISVYEYLLETNLIYSVKNAFPDGTNSFKDTDPSKINEELLEKAEDAYYRYLDFSKNIENAGVSEETVENVKENFEEMAGEDSWAHTELSYAEENLKKEDETEKNTEPQKQTEIREPETEPVPIETEKETETEAEIETEKQTEEKPVYELNDTKGMVSVNVVKKDGGSFGKSERLYILDASSFASFGRTEDGITEEMMGKAVLLLGGMSDDTETDGETDLVVAQYLQPSSPITAFFLVGGYVLDQDGNREEGNLVFTFKVSDMDLVNAALESGAEIKLFSFDEEGNAEIVSDTDVSLENGQVVFSSDDPSIYMYGIGIVRKEGTDSWSGFGSEFSGYDASESSVTMTDEERKEAAKASIDNIRELKLKIHETMMEVEEYERKIEACDVRATVNGIVERAGSVESGGDYDEFIIITGGKGMYVEGTIGETLLSSIGIGSTIKGVCYDTGADFTAEIVEISVYPVDASSGYSYTSNANSGSQYPFYAYITEQDEVVEGYIDFSFQETQTGSKLYLENFFIKTDESGKSYVFVDNDGVLEKRYVMAGTTIDGGYATEILAGIRADDYIAFPYGKNVEEGAKTEKTEMLELYG